MPIPMPMPIDIDSEELIHFVEAPKYFPGRKPCIQSLHRWRLNGVTGANGQKVKLETIKVSGLRYTSREAISRFIRDQNATGEPVPQFTPSQRRRQAETADRLLQEAGL